MKISIEEKAMEKEQAHIQATVTLNLDTYFDADYFRILPDQLGFIKDTIVNEIEEKMHRAVMAIDTFDTDYTIEEVLINGEYV